MGVYGIELFFQALFLISNFDFNVRYCGIIQPGGILTVFGIKEDPSRYCGTVHSTSSV